MYNEALFTPKYATLETVRTSFPLGHISRQDLKWRTYSLFLAFELQDDIHLLGDMLEESDKEIVLSAACCFMRRNLTRIQDYFEQTLPRYLPDEFKHHFRMTRETCELLSR